MTTVRYGPALEFATLALCALGALLLPRATSGQDLVINEVMSSNGGTLRDEDGEFPDWIEVHNKGDSGIDLAGHGLSDGDDPPQWVFPSLVIPPNGYLVVFASGKNRVAVPAHWETVIDWGDEWRYLIPASEPDPSWRVPGYDDGAWSRGRTGIGYGDGDDRTVVPQGTISVYARKTFHVDDPNAIRHVFLDIDFDDAFVAFLNGDEIARENIRDQGGPPVYTDVADGYTEPRLVFGGELSHYRDGRYRSLLRPGENVLAIQLHNSGPGSSDLTLIPFLTLGMDTVPPDARGPADVLRSTLPSLHTSFKISSAGETITLTSPAGVLTDSVAIGYLPVDISAGRFPDGTGDFSFHIEPTPGASNDAPGFASISGEVVFSHEGGFHPGPITLALSSEDLNGAIHVTIDGSVPTIDSPRYQSPLRIDSTTVVRARVLDSGSLPGKTVTHTYFLGEGYALPVVSVSTDPANFFDPEAGIYVLGEDYDPSFPHFGANFWEDWERPVHLEFFEPDGALGFSQDAGAKIFGGWSRGFPQRSLSLFARKMYGSGRFRYRIFPQKRIEEYEAFILRNSGNDWQRSHCRDGMMTSLLDDLDIDRQAYRPAVVFINAEYWGIMNLREKVNEHFVAGNHEGVDPDAIDLLERNATAIHGDAEHYRALISLLESDDASDPAVYARVKEMIDVDNFIDYQAAEIYFDNTDWPGNNIKFWRPRVEGGRWRWILFDTDFGFGIWNANNYVNNTLAFALEANGPGWPNPPWSTLMLRSLIRNEEFVAAFVNRFATHLSTIFTAQKVIVRIDEMAAALEPEMPAQRNRWGSSVSAWRSEVQVLRNFASRRVSYVRSHLRSVFGLGDTGVLEVDLDSAGGGVVEIAGLPMSQYPFTGTYFRDVPISVVARPDPGYRFSGWSGISPPDEASLTVVLSTPVLSIRAGFAIDCAAASRVVINEINYNAPDAADPGDWVELHNPWPAAVDLGGWTFRDSSDDHVFVIPDGTVLPAAGHLVLCSDTAAFRRFFPEVDDCLGDLGYSLSGAGELLRLLDAAGDAVDSLTYGDEYPWPEAADGEGATLALRNPVLDNAYAPYWAASESGGSPGSRNADVFEEIESDCIRDEDAFLRGDCNDDGRVDLADAVCTLFGLFHAGFEPTCVTALNANGDEVVDLSDAIYVLTFLFRGGPPPPPPYPGCGRSDLPADEELGCEAVRAGCQR